MRGSFLRSIFGGFIGGIVLWAIIYGLLNYTSLIPSAFALTLEKILGAPAQIIVILLQLIKDKAGISLPSYDWFFVEPISWGIVGALFSAVMRIIRY